MAKRDFIYDTKAGRVSLAILAVFLLVMGLVLVVLSVLLGRAEKDGFWQTLVLGVASVVYGVCNLVVLKKRKARGIPEEEGTDVAEGDCEPIQIAGEPDDVIVVNPTKANEPDGSILIYRKEGILVFYDKQIPLDKIVDVSVTNVSNPYIPGAYHLLLVLSDGKVAHIPAGSDREWANEALIQLREAIFGKAV